MRFPKQPRWIIRNMAVIVIVDLLMVFSIFLCSRTSNSSTFDCASLHLAGSRVGFTVRFVSRHVIQTNSVTHSMQPNHFSFWMFRKSDKNSWVFEEWYLHDLRPPDWNYLRKTSKCPGDMALQYQPPLNSIRFDWTHFSSNVFKAFLVFERYDYIESIVCQAYVCLRLHCQTSPFPISDIVTIVFLSYCSRCFIDCVKTLINATVRKLKSS